MHFCFLFFFFCPMSYLSISPKMSFDIRSGTKNLCLPFVRSTNMGLEIEMFHGFLHDLIEFFVLFVNRSSGVMCPGTRKSITKNRLNTNNNKFKKKKKKKKKTHKSESKS